MNAILSHLFKDISKFADKVLAKTIFGIFAKLTLDFSEFVGLFQWTLWKRLIIYIFQWQYNQYTSNFTEALLFREFELKFGTLEESAQKFLPANRIDMFEFVEMTRKILDNVCARQFSNIHKRSPLQKWSLHKSLVEFSWCSKCSGQTRRMPS